jgi:hypothetical protein
MSTEATRLSGVISEDLSLAHNLLHGADEIARFIYGSSDEPNRRRIYYAAEKHGLPVFKLGGVMSARKTTILRWISNQEQTGGMGK